MGQDNRLVAVLEEQLDGDVASPMRLAQRDRGLQRFATVVTAGPRLDPVRDGAQKRLYVAVTALEDAPSAQHFDPAARLKPVCR